MKYLIDVEGRCGYKGFMIVKKLAKYFFWNLTAQYYPSLFYDELHHFTMVSNRQFDLDLHFTVVFF